MASLTGRLVAGAYLLLALALVIWGIVSAWQLATVNPAGFRQTFIALGGTLMVATGGILLGILPGIGGALYLELIQPGNWTGRLIHITHRSVSGLPGVVFGMFGWVFFQVLPGKGPSLIAGMATLSLMAVPLVMRGVSAQFRTIPQSSIYSATALGMGKMMLIRTLYLPVMVVRLPGIFGFLFRKLSGETAPLLFTAAAFSLSHFSLNPENPGIFLSTSLFNLLQGEGSPSVRMALGMTAGLLWMITLAISLMVNHSTDSKPEYNSFNYNHIYNNDLYV